MMKTIDEMISTLNEVVLELRALIKDYAVGLKQEDEVYLRSDEVADLLNLNVRTVQRYGQRKILRTKRIGNTTVYLKSDIFGFIANS